MEGTEDIPGQHFLVGDDPASFAEQCGRLLRNAQLRRRIDEAGQELFRSNYNPGVLPAIFHSLFSYEGSPASAEMLGTTPHRGAGRCPAPILTRNDACLRRVQAVARLHRVPRQPARR